MRDAKVLLAGGVLILAGCSFAPEPRTPAVVLDIPAEYPAGVDDTSADGSDALAAEAREPERWWTVYNDPVLEALVDTALAANLDLREAIARVEEVRERYRIARADLIPSLGLAADASYQDTPTNAGFAGEIGGGGEEGEPGQPPGGSLFPDRFKYDTYTAAIGFSYEIDFWGRARNDTKAAVSDFLASEGDYQTARLAVISAVISTYLEVVELRRSVELTRESVDILEERADRTNERYLRGLVTTFELYTIEALYRNTQAALPVLESALAEAEGRLAILLGRYAGSLDEILNLESRPAVVLDDVPADLTTALLEERPDVWAAWQRMEAARYRIGARKAQLYPAIRLDATVGLQAGDIGDLFRLDQYFLNLVGGLTQPLFQGGRLRANVGVAEAQFQAQAANYVRTVLTAFKEVQTSLVNLEKQSERYEFLSQQLVSAQGSLAFQRRSFERGVGDYLAYLDAKQNLAGTQTNLAAAERSLAEARLAVHRALGGAWIDDGNDLDRRLEQEYRIMDEEMFSGGTTEGAIAGPATDSEGPEALR
ncbi:MAG: TolC family protein [marine benthic group bacterium]|nr:TolC family protein [Gemmatimonadota bacterium]